MVSRGLLPALASRLKTKRKYVPGKLAPRCNQSRNGKLSWFHSIELPGGYITPGIKPLALMKQEYANTFDKIQG